MKMAAKELRCSVERAMKLPEDDIDKAIIAASAKQKYREFMLEAVRKK